MKRTFFIATASALFFTGVSFVCAQSIEKSAMAVKVSGPATIDKASLGSLILVNEGAELLASGRTGEAEFVLGQAVVANPDSPEAMYNFGLALGFNGKFAESVRAHLKATQLKPQFPEAHLALGNLYLSAGENEQALLAFDQVSQIAHNDALRRSALFNRATALIRLNSLEEAELALSECLVLDPLDTAPAISLANLHAKKGNYEMALGWLESVSSEFQLEASFLRCRILIRNKELAKARSAIAEARKLLDAEKTLDENHRAELNQTLETMNSDLVQLQ